MESGYKVSTENIDHKIDTIIVTNFDYINKVVSYGWLGESDKKSLFNAVGKWIIKYK